MLYVTVALLLCCSVQIKAACEDLVSPTSITIVTDLEGNHIEDVTSCARIVKCYPGLCDKMGKENGRCCQACKAAGTPDCLNKASECSPIYIIPFNASKIEITSCDTIVSDYPSFCAKNQFGGPKKSCCKACSESTTTTAAITETTSTMAAVTETTTTAAITETTSTMAAVTETTTVAAITERTSTMAAVTETTTMAAITETTSTMAAVTEMKECTDSVTESNWINSLDSDRNFIEKLTSCDRLIACYPGLCRKVGGPGGRCCQSCKQVGDPNCLNSASVCRPVYALPGGNPKKKIPIPSCNIVVKDYLVFCKEGSFGGQGNACCKACKEAPNPAPQIPCIDSTTWKLGKGKRAKTCAKLAKKAKKIRSCCKKNKKTKGTPLRCRAACCASCAPYL